MGDKSQEYRQIIIVRKDLGMSPGKLAAQAAHASMAFLTTDIVRNSHPDGKGGYACRMSIDGELFDNWISGIFTKIVLGAKNRNHIGKAISIAEELGMQEGTDFFVIRDACLTELSPEEYDENGNGWTVTCVGFKPMAKEDTLPISKKFQLLS